MDCSNPALGYASVGDSSMALGKAGANGVVSLGDRGSATCSFPLPIRDGAGYDFAVFENGFDNYFLELAIVEVSSNGTDFFAFPSHSLTDTLLQKGSFDSLDATQLNNLAGKYRGGFGTPFDLQELQGHAALNTQAVTHIRVKDVVGAINNQYATRDAFNNKINDPWPSPFPSGGFDLDAIGVIHQNTQLRVDESAYTNELVIYPNPIQAGESLYIQSKLNIKQARLTNVNGVSIPLLVEGTKISLPQLTPGIYHLELFCGESYFHNKLVLQN